MGTTLETRIINDGLDSAMYLSDDGERLMISIDFSGNRGVASLDEKMIEDLMAYCLRWKIAKRREAMLI